MESLLCSGIFSELLQATRELSVTKRANAKPQNEIFFILKSFYGCCFNFEIFNKGKMPKNSYTRIMDPPIGG